MNRLGVIAISDVATSVSDKGLDEGRDSIASVSSVRSSAATSSPSGAAVFAMSVGTLCAFTTGGTHRDSGVSVAHARMQSTAVALNSPWMSTPLALSKPAVTNR